MKHVGHFIAGEFLPADGGSQIFNPSNGKPTAIAAIGTSAGRTPQAMLRSFEGIVPKNTEWTTLGAPHDEHASQTTPAA